MEGGVEEEVGGVYAADEGGGGRCRWWVDVGEERGDGEGLLVFSRRCF